jgi:hypothetical protein
MMFTSSGKRDCYTTGVERVADDRVAKFVGRDVEVEFQKALAIEHALAGTPFSSPKALSFDLSTGLIEFEYIGESISLYAAIAQSYRSRKFDSIVALNRAAGELLAILHRNLKLSSAVPWEPPSRLAEYIKRTSMDRNAEDQVFLHCDFSPVNLLVKPSGHLVLIDSSPNQYFTTRADLIGPPAVDIATYTAKLFWPFRTRTFTFAGRRIAHRLRNDFVDCYEHAFGRPVDRNFLSTLEATVVQGFILRKTDSFALSTAAMWLARMALPN